MSSKKESLKEKVRIGRIFKAKRVFLGLTQTEVARRVGVSQMMISHFEAGRSQPVMIKEVLNHMYKGVEVR